MRHPVLLLNQSLGLGGTETQLSAIVRALDRDRFQPHVGLMRREGFRLPEIESAGIPVVNFGVRSFIKPSVVGGAMRLIRYVHQHGIRLVHAFDAPAVLFGVPAATMACGPVVLSSQRSHRELTPGAHRGLARWGMRLTDRISTGIVVNCRYLAQHLIEDEGVPEKSLLLCYNGIDTGVFHARGRSKPPVLANASVVVGVVCALRPEKNLAVLLLAFSQVYRYFPGATLAIVGDGSCREELRQLARELAIEDKTLFLPATVDVADWLRAIDIFVLPSTTEGFSNSLLEAMACGCSVVASRVGGNPEMITQGETGLLFDSHDVAALSSALRLLLENGSMRERLAKNAADLVESRFSLTASAQRMGEIYSTLLSR